MILELVSLEIIEQAIPDDKELTWTRHFGVPCHVDDFGNSFGFVVSMAVR